VVGWKHNWDAFVDDDSMCDGVAWGTEACVGLLLRSSESEVDKLRAIVNGWRTIESSGKEVLPAECFVACNQSFVPNENAVQFKERWANRESKLKEMRDSEDLAMSVSKIAQSLIEQVDLSIPE